MDSSKRNCFDALRLALATSVIYGHSYPLGGFGMDPLALVTKGQVHIETDAVVGFFGISGYLIAASWERSNSGLEFMRKRIRRIFPGFWCCLFVTAFLIAPAIHATRNHSLSGFPWTGSNSAASFVWRNAALILRQWTVGATLANNPHSGAINSSLWSLFPEFGCYAALGILAYLGGISRQRSLLVFAVLGLAAAHGLALLNPSATLLPTIICLGGMSRFYLAFAIGAAMHTWRALLILDRKGQFFLLGVLLVLARNGGYALFSPVLIPWLLISFGESVFLKLPADVSYGTYLYGFAIQQFLISLPWFGRSWLLYFVTSVVVALGTGWLSWTLVERHFLSRSRAA